MQRQHDQSSGLPADTLIWNEYIRGKVDNTDQVARMVDLVRILFVSRERSSNQFWQNHLKYVKIWAWFSQRVQPLYQAPLLSFTLISYGLCIFQFNNAFLFFKIWWRSVIYSSLRLTPFNFVMPICKTNIPEIWATLLDQECNYTVWEKAREEGCLGKLWQKRPHCNGKD